jgi:hypothetical protein
MILRRSDPDMFVASGYLRLFRFTALGLFRASQSGWILWFMVDICRYNYSLHGCFYGVYKPTVT